MRACFIHLRVTITAITLSSAAICCNAANILANPGFESGALSPWFQDQSNSTGLDFQISSADAHGGAFSALGSGERELHQSFAAVPTSDLTQVSFWVRHPQPRTGEYAPVVFVTLFYSDSTVSHPSHTVTQGTGWEFFDITDQLISGKSLVGLSLWSYAELFSQPLQPPTYLDDVTINVVPEPASCLFILPLTGFLTRQRRRGEKDSHRRDTSREPCVFRGVDGFRPS